MWHLFFYGAATQRGSWPPHSWGFLDHIQRRTTVGRTLLGEWSARCRDFYLTTHNTHNRQTSMTPVGFEPTISAGERPQTYALDRAATGTGNMAPIRYPITLQHSDHTTYKLFWCWFGGSLMSVTMPSTHNLLDWETNIRNSRGSDYEGFCGPVYDTV